MKDWKCLVKRILFLPLWLIVLLTLISTVSLVMIFTKGMETSIIAYICYVISFYALTVLCVFGWKVVPGYVKRIKEKLHQNKYTDKYLTDVMFKTRVGLYRSLAISVIYVVVYAFSAYIYHTNWFGIFAIYYGIIGMMRFLLVNYTRGNPIGENYLAELKRAKLCAYILLTVNLTLSGAVLMMVYFNKGFEYKGFLIYVIALYTFYLTISAIVDMVRYRKYKSPIMSITKVIKMTSSLFSMLFLETAMLAQFGGDVSPSSKRIMIMMTGAGISVIVVIMAVYMIVTSTKEIKKNIIKECEIKEYEIKEYIGKDL